MKVLFTNAPWYKEADKINDKPGWLGIRAGSRWPHTIEYNGGCLVSRDYLPFPFFLSTACALAKRSGLEAEIRDSIALGETYESFYTHVEQSKADIVVIETSTPSLDNDIEIAGKVKELLPGVKTVFTGIHFELEQNKFLECNNSIDYIVNGEYENSLNNLLIELKKGNTSELHDVKGILFRSEKGVVKTESATLIPLDELPWPVQDEAAYENYYDAVCGLEKPQFQVITTRGCPYGCIFCVWPQLVYKGKSYRMRSPEDVVNEIEHNFAQREYKSFYIDDDTFNVNREHILGIAKELKKRKLDKYPWGAMCRADLMTEEILDELKSAGLYSVKYGVESGSQAILDEINKGLDLEKVIKIVKYTKKIGIKVHLTFTFGLPGDTLETIEDTIALACKLPEDSVQFSIATPFPGTIMYKMYEEKGWITTKDWRKYNGSAEAVSRTETFSGKELEAFIELAYRKTTEARIGRAVENGKFKTVLNSHMSGAMDEKRPVLLLQSAVQTLTKTILKSMLESGADIHLLLHRRFMDKFKDLLPEDKLHIFDNSTNFNYDALKTFAAELKEKYNFCGAVVPYSNPSGGGYDEVEEVAVEAAGTILAGISSEGRIIK